ncbi:MAG: hypothetical protein O2816_16315 [Planctomycetota bacterium]|nr:hypothetical protein [Planctomycetota bacterium]
MDRAAAGLVVGVVDEAVHVRVDVLRALLQRASGRIADAAKLSGLNTRSLYEKMRRYGLRKEHFKLV